MVIPVVRPYPYGNTPKRGGKPVTSRPANIQERRVPRTRHTRPIAKGQPILKRPSSRPVPVNPPPVAPPPPQQQRNKTVQVAAGPVPAGAFAVGGIRSGRLQQRKVERRGRSIRPAHNESIVRAHVNKVRELRNVGSGRILAMIACGPSINEIPLDQLKGHPRIDIMSINKPDKRLWPTTYWAFCDMSQYTRNKELWDTYDGVVINSSAVKVGHRRQVLIRTRSGQGFSKDLANGFYVGRSTTYANLQTAIWMGYERIYLFGCDMGAVNGQMHFYGKNPDVDDKNREQRFAREAEHYHHAAATLPESDRKRIFFCSSYNQWPFVRAFNHRDHKNVIPEILDYANRKS